MSNRLTESVIEDATLEWFAGLGYAALHGHPPQVRLPPDKQERATRIVLKQAEHLCAHWAA